MPVAHYYSRPPRFEASKGYMALLTKKQEGKENGGPVGQDIRREIRGENGKENGPETRKGKNWGLQIAMSDRHKQGVHYNVRSGS
jgi:hypothetical protein